MRGEWFRGRWDCRAAPEPAGSAAVPRPPNVPRSRNRAHSGTLPPRTRELLARRKAPGNRRMEALRVLERRISDAVFHAMANDHLASTARQRSERPSRVLVFVAGPDVRAAIDVRCRRVPEVWGGGVLVGDLVGGAVVGDRQTCAPPVCASRRSCRASRTASDGVSPVVAASWCARRSVTREPIVSAMSGAKRESSCLDAVVAKSCVGGGGHSEGGGRRVGGAQ